jgi:hypothetical protein
MRINISSNTSKADTSKICTTAPTSNINSPIAQHKSSSKATRYEKTPIMPAFKVYEIIGL